MDPLGTLKRCKLGIVVVLVEIAMLVLFGVFVRYDELLGKPNDINVTNGTNSSTAKEKAADSVSHVVHYYASKSLTLFSSQFFFYYLLY